MSRILHDYPQVSLKIDFLQGRLDFSQIFGRNRPVHIEIGCGKGTFLLNQAKQHTEVDFLGIEWASKYYRHAVDRIGRWGLRNVRIVRTEAASFLADFLEDESTACFHIYFPDPWPKKRHHKRRFFNEANLEQMIRSLVLGGVIRVATDHKDYFEQIESVLARQGDKLDAIDFAPGAGAADGELIGTNYERKYIKDKREIYAVAVRKICS